MRPVGISVSSETCYGVVPGQARLFVKTTSKKIAPGQIVFAQDVRPASPVEESVDACRTAIHYDLVEVVWTDHMVAHIPAPFFLEFDRGLEILLHLPHSARFRNHEFFHCPICGEASYFAGPCRNCGEGYTPETIYTKYKWASWHTHEKKKKARKVHLLGRLRHGHRAPKTVSRMEYVVALPRL